MDLEPLIQRLIVNADDAAAGYEVAVRAAKSFGMANADLNAELVRTGRAAVAAAADVDRYARAMENADRVTRAAIAGPQKVGASPEQLSFLRGAFGVGPGGMAPTAAEAASMRAAIAGPGTVGVTAAQMNYLNSLGGFPGRGTTPSSVFGRFGGENAWMEPPGPGAFARGFGALRGPAGFLGRGLGSAANAAGDVLGGAAQLAAITATITAVQMLRTAYRDLVGTMEELTSRAVSVGMAFERQRTAFGVMTGGREQGNALFGQVQQLSLNTPYSIETLSDMAKYLLAAGTASEQVIPTLSRLGDIASGDAVKFNQLARDLERVTLTGRVTQRELRTFAAVGIGGPDIAKTMGLTNEQFQVALHAGDVGPKNVIAALNQLTDAGGRFFQSNQQQLGTVSGQWTRLKNVIDLTLGTLGENAFSRFDVAGTIGKAGDYLLTHWQDISDAVGGVLDRLNVVAQEVGNVGLAAWQTFTQYVTGSTAPSLEQVRAATVDITNNLITFADRAIGAFSIAADAAVSFGKALDNDQFSVTKLVQGLYYFGAVSGSYMATAGSYASFDQTAAAQRRSTYADFRKYLTEEANRPDRPYFDATTGLQQRLAALRGGGGGGVGPGGPTLARMLGMPTAFMPVGGPLDAFGRAGIEAPGGVPPDVMSFVEKVNKQFEQKGIDPLQQFQATQRMIARSAGLLKPGVADFSLFQDYEQLRKHVGGQEAYPEAAFQGSAAAAGAVARAQFEQKTVQQEVRDIMAEALIQDQQQTAYMRDVLAELRGAPRVAAAGIRNK